jgi:hypothetical protein
MVRAGHECTVSFGAWKGDSNLIARYQSSGRPITFGETSTGKYIAVVFDVVEEDPLAVYPVTAYEPTNDR